MMASGERNHTRKSLHVIKETGIRFGLITHLANLTLCNRSFSRDVIKTKEPPKFLCSSRIRGAVFSSIASFVWKPAYFEFQSCGGARHKVTITFIKNIYICFVIFTHLRS